MRRANSTYKGASEVRQCAQISFALLHDENRLLFKQNDEAKRRRSTKSTVVGKAKVMSYEDIEAARGKHAAKEAAATASQKRGRKRKSPAPAGAKARKSEAEVAENEIATAGLEIV